MFPNAFPALGNQMGRTYRGCCGFLDFLSHEGVLPLFTCVVICHASLVIRCCLVWECCLGCHLHRRGCRHRVAVGGGGVAA